MKVNDIISKLEKGGFKVSRAHTIVNINCDGGYLVGKYLGTVEFEDEDGKMKENYKFSVIEGAGLLKKDAKTAEPVEKGSEVVIFGSGLLKWILTNKHKVGDTVAVVYKGMEKIKRGKKMVNAHQHEVMAFDGK